jgi:hypothetical protein
MKELKMTSAEQYIHMVRLHNLPKNSALCQILHFLWESIDFESEEAYIRAYSYKNAIVGFTQRIFADNAGLLEKNSFLLMVPFSPPSSPILQRSFALWPCDFGASSDRGGLGAGHC